MKLTKTEQALLAKSVTCNHKVCGLQLVWWISGTRKYSYGRRERNALKMLIQKGLAVVLDTYSGAYQPKYKAATIQDIAYLYRLTPAGIEFSETDKINA